MHRLTGKQKETLKAFLAIECSLAQAPETLRGFTHKAGLDLDNELQAFEARLSAMNMRRLPTNSITYRASFGRQIDYYTGLVFEMVAGDQKQPVTMGGRYDRLLGVLGAKKDIAGIGFSTWLGESA